MKFYSFFLNILRRIFKSFEKKEKILSRLIIYSHWKKRKDLNSIVWNENFENLKNISTVKIAICVVFLYSEKRLEYLKKICSNFLNSKYETDITIITDAKDNSKIEKIKHFLPNKKNINILRI